MTQAWRSRLAARGSAASLLLGLVMAGCGPPEEKTDDTSEVPANFSPAFATANADGRTARCNTAHSLALPAEILARLDVRADSRTAVIVCSLQRMRGGEPVNLPARVFGAATATRHGISRIDFKEFGGNGLMSYAGSFLFHGEQVGFRVTVIDPADEQRFRITFVQSH